MPKNELIYPIFLECLEYTDDNFWKFIFEDLAYGKAPHGTYISKNFLCCNFKGKEFSYKIVENGSSETIFNDIYEILTKKFRLLSSKDKILRKKNFENKEEEIKTNCSNNWNLIRKKNIKNALIENFVIEKKEKYILSDKQYRNLISTIIVGLFFKSIKSDDISYKDSIIDDIKGISFDTGKIILDAGIKNFNSTCLVEIPNTTVLMSENWEKYIYTLSKTII